MLTSEPSCTHARVRVTPINACSSVLASFLGAFVAFSELHRPAARSAVEAPVVCRHHVSWFQVEAGTAVDAEVLLVQVVLIQEHLMDRYIRTILINTCAPGI